MAGAYGFGGKRPYPSDGEGFQQNDKQRKRAVNNLSQQIDSSDETVYRILCPASKIGRIIGKGGNVIKELRYETRSKITVEEAAPGSDERVICIASSAKEAGDRKSKDAGNSDIKEEMHCAAQEALFRVHTKIIEADHAGDEPVRSVTTRLLVPNNQTGCLLGKGGKIIEQMRKEIGGQIRVMPKEQIPACAWPNDELVQLSGDLPTVRKALYAVSTRLYENPPRERPQGAPLPQASTFPVPDPLYSNVSYYPHSGSLLAPSAGAPFVGLGHSLPPLGTGVGSAWPLGSGFPVGPPPFGIPDPLVTETSPGEEFTVRILFPNEKMGSMIGKGGSIIRKLREETGARIKVGEPITGSDERVINIKSKEYLSSTISPAIDVALQIQKRLAELSTDKDKEVTSVTTRVLVPSSQIGSLLGKGGFIISEMRKVTRAKIQIPAKSELPPCAEEDDELVQISGTPHTAQAALVQVLERLRGNLFKNNDTGNASGFLPSLSGAPLPSTASLFPSYGGMHELESTGGLYPLTGLGLTHASNYGGYGSAPPVSTQSGRMPRDSHRKQKA